MNTKKLLTVSMIVAMVASLLMIATVFMPYSVATEDQAELYMAYPDEEIYPGSDITASDMVGLSMFEYARIYGSYGDVMFGDDMTGAVYAGMVAVIALFALLSLVFSALKKPIPVLIFSVISFLVFLLQNWDYTDRGVVPSDSYVWGLGYYLFFVAFTLTFAAAVWMLVNKIIIKKQGKSIQA